MPTKTKRPLYKTPTGEVKFAWIVVPNTNYKAEGEFSIDLRFSPDDAGVAELKKLLDEAIQKQIADAIAEEPKKAAAIKKYKINCPLKVEMDPETAEPTGKLVFRSSESAVWKDNKTNEVKDRSIDILDAKLNKLVKPKVGRGTKAKVAFTLYPHVIHAQQAIGVKAYLKAVQIIDLVEFNGGTYGFGAEEGYEGEQEPSTFSNEETPATAGKAAGDF